MRFPSVRSLIVLLALGFALPAAAQTADEVRAYANDLGHKALAVMTTSGLGKDEKQDRLEALFAQNVDIDWVGKFVLGRYWRDASEDQKQRYLANYRTFLIKHYTSNLSEFTDVNFAISKVAPAENGGFVVGMRIKRPQAEDVVIDYAIRRTGAGLKVYDITVEGVSMITTQRSEFSSVVSQKGLDYLIAQLKARSAHDEGVAGGS